MIHFIRHIFPFRKLAPKVLNELGIFTEKKVLKPRVPLFQQEDKVKHLWIIIQGTVVLSTTAAGKMKIGPKKKLGQKKLG